jgi:hypothetical protein
MPHRAPALVPPGDSGAFSLEQAGFTQEKLRKLFGAPPVDADGEAVELLDAGGCPEVYELELTGTMARVVGPNKAQARRILRAVCQSMGYQEGSA